MSKIAVTFLLVLAMCFQAGSAEAKSKPKPKWQPLSEATERSAVLPVMGFLKSFDKEFKRKGIYMSSFITYDFMGINWYYEEQLFRKGDQDAMEKNDLYKQAHFLDRKKKSYMRKRKKVWEHLKRKYSELDFDQPVFFLAKYGRRKATLKIKMLSKKGIRKTFTFELKRIMRRPGKGTKKKHINISKYGKIEWVYLIAK